MLEQFIKNLFYVQAYVCSLYKVVHHFISSCYALMLTQNRILYKSSFSAYCWSAISIQICCLCYIVANSIQNYVRVLGIFSYKKKYDMKAHLNKENRQNS